MAPATSQHQQSSWFWQPTSVLKQTWQEALTSGSLKRSLFLHPFSGKVRLPTREQIILLYYAIKEVKEWDWKAKEDC